MFTERNEVRIKFQIIWVAIHRDEQLVSTIESAVQCQICMDIPERPFA
jgi:hypothetical protein